MTQNEGRFHGRTALVTGAGGNIGLATALRLASEGAAIALVDIDPGKLSQAKEAFAAHGTRVEAYTCNVADRVAVSAVVDQVIGDFGAVDLLFNNAGFQGAFRPIHEYPEDDFEKVMKINVFGAFYILKAVSKHMVERRFGRIVNTASMAGVQGPPNMLAYGASKFSIVGLTQIASKDLAPYNIRVNAISPAFMGPGYMWDRQVELQAEAGTQYFSSDPTEVAKQMIASVPMRRYGDISEIPGVVSFLMSDDSSYMTGVNLPISGGIL
ncbi:xylitol dehydrogenase [Gluconacetobacter johannae DSM 13595]|uniref:SDR family oxidoreductase n=1 Tax=Gluconacetobacter johannae TaxID=112140 RepID=A0A7W4J930_9PROT|nr:SDR family oxidoreductase [Gluconacetobacter johannae]MBB2176941.1 SDR family oxidoreductase [Gluconacetobacter johannae]GBQ89625.1 xylitol dehydrogenase [Gluconacetobacter johannae DSM 13595]